ncbi:MAG TPA: hypothetical protein VKF61_09935 [Candidatus Polarisedimenticolia bacterium]|nr:hypothetical protein [Candidatus Polarisedimenticolia bacterium]
MTDNAPKSAYEIALEKLRQRDRERGEAAPATLTDEQKRRIAAIRKTYEARLAEREILYRSEREKALADPESEEKLRRLEEDFVKDRRRIEERRDREIEAVRGGAAGPEEPRPRSSEAKRPVAGGGDPGRKKRGRAS